MGPDELAVAKNQGNASQPPDGRRPQRAALPRGRRTGQVLSRSARPCNADARFLQPGALVVAQSLGSIDQTLHNLGIVLWAVGLIGVIGAALAGNAVAQSGLQAVGPADRCG